jgi:hypothetical protein
MYAWRYLLTSLPTAGLLAPVGLAWTLGRFSWRQAGIALLIALLFWLPAMLLGQLVLILLWYLSLVGLNAWVAGGLKEPSIWLRSAGLVLSQLTLGLGLAVLIIPLIAVDQTQLTVPRDWFWWIGGGLALLGLAGMELVVRLWARKAKHAARP